MFNREAYILKKSPIEKDLLNLFKPNQKLIIFDIGSCEGEDSVKYSKLFPKARILAFEPLPDNQELIKKNLHRYEINNVELIPFALSDKKGTVDFHVSSGNPEGISNNDDWNFGNKSSSLLKPDKHLEVVPWVKFDQVISVQTNTMQNVSEELNILEVDFVHMDVQGAELMVLKGAGTFLKNIKTIWMEVSNITLYQDQPIKNQIEKFMEENGFYLFINETERSSGDQMYINQKYFKLKCLLIDLKRVPIFIFLKINGLIKNILKKISK